MIAADNTTDSAGTSTVPAGAPAASPIVEVDYRPAGTSTRAALGVEIDPATIVGDDIAGDLFAREEVRLIGYTRATMHMVEVALSRSMTIDGGALIEGGITLEVSGRALDAVEALGSGPGGALRFRSAEAVRLFAGQLVAALRLAEPRGLLDDDRPVLPAPGTAGSAPR